MPTRPTLLRVSQTTPTKLNYEFDQDMSLVGTPDPTVFRGKKSDGIAIIGVEVSDLTDEVLKIEFEEGPADVVAFPGETTCLYLPWLVGTAGGLKAFPFVNRDHCPRLVSVTYGPGANQLTLVWSRDATLQDATKFKWTDPAGVHKRGTTIASGDTTSVWILDSTTAANGIPINTYDAADGVSADVDGSPSPIQTGPISG